MTDSITDNINLTTIMDHNRLGILDLPIEMLHEIIMNLNVTDIPTFTRVCKHFYNAINRDYIWRPLCQKFCNKITYVIDYVNTMPSTVEPLYSPHQEVQASPNKWKSVCRRLIHLKTNFTQGNYKMQSFEHFFNRESGTWYLFEDLLLFRGPIGNDIQVWSVRNNPRFLGTIVAAYKNIRLPYKIFCVAKNTVIIAQGTILQVFKINVESGGITRMYRRLIYGDNNSDIPKAERIDPWPKDTEKVSHCATCVSGHYIICVVRIYEQNVLHQWNIETGKKVYELNISIQVEEFFSDSKVDLYAPVTYSGDVLAVLHKTDGHNKTVWVIYRFNVHSHIFKLFLTDPENVSFHLPSIHYENNTVAIINRETVFDVLSLYLLPPHSATPQTYSFKSFETGNNGITDFKMRGNILSYVLRRNLIIKNTCLKDLYQIISFENNDRNNASYYLCDWNIVLVSFFDLSQEISFIELHDFMARSCLKTVPCDGLVIGALSPLRLILQNKNDYPRNMKLLQFW